MIILFLFILKKLFNIQNIFYNKNNNKTDTGLLRGFIPLNHYHRFNGVMGNPLHPLKKG